MIILVSDSQGEESSDVAYYAVQLVGVGGSGGVRGGLHLLGQAARAIQGVCGGPLEKSLLSIEEEQLQGQVRTGSLHGR